jgi:ABC-type uncharacterized transport system permease subunit
MTALTSPKRPQHLRIDSAAHWYAAQKVRLTVARAMPPSEAAPASAAQPGRSRVRVHWGIVLASVASLVLWMLIGRAVMG